MEATKAPTGYSERFNRALLWAADIHCQQTRKGKDVPYINHLLAVASIIGSNGGDEDQVIAGLLHDAIEDCVGERPTIVDEIAQKFGDRVLYLVEGCTDAYEEPKPEWSKRKTAYLAHLRDLPDDSPILLVSLADKVHNARSIVRDLFEVGDELWARFNAGCTGTLWYYDSLATIFADKKPGYLATELRFLVDNMKEKQGVTSPAKNTKPYAAPRLIRLTKISQETTRR